ncbi:MAG: SGNH/GDSL hydrolase family protein [Verrucomicrobiales bacterium]|nr:SGNH/GDSL hydrolase family protein [Verrucomicrobiales bacterium]
MKLPLELLLSLSLMLSGGLLAQAPVEKKSPPKPVAKTQAAAIPTLKLEDGDTFVFLGDSITHQCLYTQYIEDFFYTRYPDRKIHFHNAGVSGDRVTHALARFEDDVAAFKPKYVSILLGMNDGEYVDFTQDIFSVYKKDMLAVLGKVTGLKAAPMLLSPTMFDHHQLTLRKDDPTFPFGKRGFSQQYNSIMAFYGGWLREQATENRYAFADFWAPLNDLTLLGRRKDVDFTLVSDTIHPDAGGQVVMAYSFLSQLNPDRRSVSAITLNQQAGKWKGRGVGGKLEGVQALSEGEGLEFTFKARSLPWVLPQEAFGVEMNKWKTPGPAVGYEMTKAGHRISNERLKVSGLKPGRYEVFIDGESIGKPVSHVQLAAKIELQANEKTPQYKQALQVALLNREKNDKVIRPLRNLWSRIKGLRNRHADDAAAFQVEYEKLKPRIEEFLKSSLDYEKRIYELAQPKARKYVVRRVGKKGK